MKTGKFKTEEEYCIEEAIRFLVEHLPREASVKKPVLLHSLRVGKYLLDQGCSLDVVIGGYLHDLIEDSDIDADKISTVFGENVAGIVQANSKDLSVEKDHLLEDLISRCASYGIDACLVKAADLIDNYQFYKNLGNSGEMLRAITQGRLLIEKMSSEMKGSNDLFLDLEEIVGL